MLIIPDLLGMGHSMLPVPNQGGQCWSRGGWAKALLTSNLDEHLLPHPLAG